MSPSPSPRLGFLVCVVKGRSRTGLEGPHGDSTRTLSSGPPGDGRRRFPQPHRDWEPPEHTLKVGAEAGSVQKPGPAQGLERSTSDNSSGRVMFASEAWGGAAPVAASRHSPAPHAEGQGRRPVRLAECMPGWGARRASSRKMAPRGSRPIPRLKRGPQVPCEVREPACGTWRSDPAVTVPERPPPVTDAESSLFSAPPPKAFPTPKPTSLSAYQSQPLRDGSEGTR